MLRRSRPSHVRERRHRLCPDPGRLEGLVDVRGISGAGGRTRRARSSSRRRDPFALQTRRQAWRRADDRKRDPGLRSAAHDRHSHPEDARGFSVQGSLETYVDGCDPDAARRQPDPPARLQPRLRQRPRIAGDAPVLRERQRAHPQNARGVVREVVRCGRRRSRATDRTCSSTARRG